ncbi:MAG TPA: ribonuclease HI family protein, partial [bacterium]|nr:ribonuclease HI family protein [bacterium]
MASELSPEAQRLVEGLISGKGLAELASLNDPARQEILRHLQSLLAPASAADSSVRPPAADSSVRPATSMRKQSTNMKSVASGSHPRAILHSDGASRGNPGPAAIGFLIRDANGTELAAEGECIGTTTNNVAEYQALLAGLRKARELGIEELEIRLDSELVVRQLNGDYKV